MNNANNANHDINLSVTLAGVTWKNPVTCASGTFGSGMEYGALTDLNALGALTTKGVAPTPWPGNPVPRIAETPSGMMNAIGLQNPGIDTFIERLPDKYETMVAENGANLSQGQRQLMCIARVMLVSPPMLILDEATSSIDTRTEIKVQQAFDEIMKGRTSFIVAHRLSTIREADVILVMKDGNIIEQGSHDLLIEKGGFYSELWGSQFAPS